MSLPEFLTLHSAACTAIWEVRAHEAPLWRYWGARLPDGVVPPAALRDTRVEPSFSLAYDQPLPLFPGFGMGWFGQSALLAHRAGADWAQEITDCAIERVDAATVRFVLHDAVAQISATITARLDPESDVLSLQTSLANHGDAPLEVQWLAAGVVPLPVGAARVISYSGRHNSEFVEQSDALSRSAWRRENRRGLTSHDCFPGALVECHDGAVYGAQLAWSGNHLQQIDWCDDGRRQWQMGEWLAPGEVRLSPGEALTSPEVLATCSGPVADGADNRVAQAFHRELRARVPWPGGKMRPRPVHLNTWEGFYFDHDLAALKDLADAAARVGIERFVLDDGWFHRRNDDRAALGDWWADARKYPDGLAPLADHVRARGMEFGLWIEPEMVNPDSELYTAHPDWALQIGGQNEGRPLRTARNQLVLDLTRAEVGDYLFAAIARVIAECRPAYLKWDHNRDLIAAGETPRYRQQVLAAYALFDRFRAAFPEIEIEACAGGGGRIDAGIAAHSHRFWTSDCIDAVARVRIQRGFLRFMPPELMGSHVGASPAHSTGRAQAMAFRAAVALPGHFGVELDLRKLGAGETRELAAAIARYKALRGVLHHGRVWQGTGDDGLLWQAHGSSTELLAFAIRTQPHSQAHPAPLRLPMLDPARRYRVAREGAEPFVAAGAWLAQVGLPLPPMTGEQVVMFELAAVEP